MTLSTPELVGRTPVLEQVVRRAHRGASTVLTGPVGIGRSRLLAEAAVRLERTGRRVLRLTATASASSVPFGVLLGLLDRPTILRIGAEDALGRAAIVRAGVLALESEVVLVDEGSLLDPGSAAFLLELARGQIAVVVAITAGRRVPDAIRALVDDDLAATLRLEPLDAAGCGDLAAALLGGPVEAALTAALVEVTEASPAAVQEVVRVARAADAIRIDEGMWRLRGELPAPAAVRRRSGAEFLALPAEAQDWLCAVAVADEVADDVAERLCDDATADAMERAGWTAHDDRAQATRMRRTAQSEAVLEAAGARQRRSTVRRLLAAVAELDRPLSDRERIARGAWALELGDELDAAEAVDLGSLTSLADPDLSERFLRHAVATGGGAAAEVLLAEQLKRTNRLDEAEQLLGSSAAAGDPRSAGDVAKVLALVAGFGSRNAGRALAVLEAHLGAHGEQEDLLAIRAGLLRSELRYPEALEAAESLRRGPTSFASVFAGINEVLVRTEFGEPWAALQVVDLLRRPALQVVDRIPEGPVMLDWLSAWAPAVAALDLRTAEAIAVRDYDRTLETGMHAVRTPFAHLLGTIRCAAGEVDTAVHLLREAVGLPGIWRDSWLPVILADLSIALIRSDDLEGAKAALEQATSDAVPPSQQGRVRLAEAELLAARQDLDGAIAIARDVAMRAGELSATVEQWDARFAALRFGDPTAAAELLALPALPGVARGLQQDHARALDAGDVPALDAVARRYWTVGLRALAIESAGAAIRLRTDQGLPTTAARERLAQWTAEVPALGGRNGGTGSATTLTSREREVVALAARGLPDRGVAEQLGISVRTAQTHLSRAFGKLGVHRPSELVGLLDDLV
ncbi:helix-turn-helix transcriptional regulator [Amnibacterium kyonggiense]|uniref:Regulatory LuxR family protein n=1 Tax=Amnibacterium kyonggiense TaxID=595671 RepID=A0A4R7FH10_9MICO|nr:LuxR C-terminal-related transcriptional regulator [Amnibacterium kyonggiense]TDS74930.1 regulatory LuxR family protein [Amnibacterium kyonggiense]